MNFQKQVVLKAGAAKQILYCVVLEPETVDLQKDILSAEEIEQACHAYNVESRVIGKSHEKDADGNTIAAEADMVESFIAPVDFEIEGEVIKKGSWVMALRINNVEMWQNVEAGLYDCLSIGGFGERVEE